MMVEVQVTERDIAIELIGGAVERGCAELGKCRTDDDKVQWLKRTIAKHDIVIGFWPDPERINPGQRSMGDFDYFIIKGEDAVFSLLYVAQAAGGGFRANHGFKTAAVPCKDREDAKAVQVALTACDCMAKLEKLFEELPPEERDALKVQYGMVSVQ
jgi:hypothetical protein